LRFAAAYEAIIYSVELLSEVLMSSRLSEIFDDSDMIERIKKRLPRLFQIAEQECARGNKIGMEVGNLRERIIVSLLSYKFDRDNIDAEVPTTEPEVDVKLFSEPISIKTITGNLAGVKLIWTVDYQKVAEFADGYYPKCDLILVHIVWNGVGGFCYIPKEAQISTFERLGKDRYITIPRQGTNPRGVEISRGALEMSLGDNRSKSIPIRWVRTDTGYDPYERWTKFWSED